MFKSSFRRLVCVVALVVIAYQYAWHKDWTGHAPFGSLGWLALVVVAVIILIIATVKHSPASAWIGAVLGGVAVGLHRYIHITFGRLLLDLLVVLGVVVITLGAIIHDMPGSRPLHRPLVWLRNRLPNNNP